jgi:hypothetical protein
MNPVTRGPVGLGDHPLGDDERALGAVEGAVEISRGRRWPTAGDAHSGNNRFYEPETVVSDQGAGPLFEVAVAFQPLPKVDLPSGPGGGLPGTDEAFGIPRAGRAHGLGGAVLEKGEEVVRHVTEALAAQIGLTAQRIAEGIGSQEVTPGEPGKFSLDSVEVMFGITLTGGVQALYTATAESSVQVTITLNRRRADGSTPV